MGDIADYETRNYDGAGPHWHEPAGDEIDMNGADDTKNAGGEAECGAAYAPDEHEGEVPLLSGWAETGLYRKEELPPPRISRDGFEERGTEAQLAALYAAMAEAYGEFAEPERTKHVHIPTKTGGPIDYDYAPLSELIAATRPALARHGLMILQPFTRLAKHRVTERWTDDQGRERAEEVWVARLLTIVSHKAGGRLVFTVEFFAENNVKDYGGQVTYTRRYQYQATTGIDAGEPDADDAPRPNSREERAVVTQRQRTAPRPADEPGQVSQPPKCPDCGAVSGHSPTCSRRPQEAKKAEPKAPPQRKSDRPPAPGGMTPLAQALPSNEELAQAMGRDLEPGGEPRVEREVPEGVARLSGDELMDAIFEAAQALGMSKAGGTALYQRVTGTADRSAASEDDHRKVLAELLKMRAQAGK